jgi:hypothetical protein
MYGENHHLHEVQEDIHRFRPLQQSEGSAAGRHVSILRRTQRGKVADGHGIHDHPEEAKRLNTDLSSARTVVERKGQNA